MKETLRADGFRQTSRQHEPVLWNHGLVDETDQRQMKRPPAVKKRAFDYPEVTIGSRLAAEVRAQANQLTDAEREELFKSGMRLIYGGDAPKETVRAGH